MSDIFKTPWTKEQMVDADDPKWGIQVVMVPSDDPVVRVPSQFAKRKWPAPVESAPRPRFGKGGY